MLSITVSKVFNKHTTFNIYDTLFISNHDYAQYVTTILNL